MENIFIAVPVAGHFLPRVQKEMEDREEQWTRIDHLRVLLKEFDKGEASTKEMINGLDPSGDALERFEKFGFISLVALETIAHLGHGGDPNAQAVVTALRIHEEEKPSLTDVTCLGPSHFVLLQKKEAGLF